MCDFSKRENIGQNDNFRSKKQDEKSLVMQEQISDKSASHAEYQMQAEE